MKNTFKKLTGVLPIEIAEVGDYVQFGALAWKVIAIEDGKKLLLSKECLVTGPDWELGQNNFADLLNKRDLFNKLVAPDNEEESTEEAESMEDDDVEEDITDDSFDFLFSEDYFNKKYRACKSDYESIQKYLRECFSEEYLSQDDIKRIVPYSVEINGHLFSDYVFLLSQDEVEKYIPKKEDRIGTIFNLIDRDIPKPWLLRFNESDRYCFEVNEDGEIIVVVGWYNKFRPAVWVK